MAKETNRWSRRRMLGTSLAGGGAAALGKPWAFAGMALDQAPGEQDAFEGGERLADLEFLDQRPTEFHRPFDEGLSGRLVTRLADLSPERLVTPNEHFFIRTRAPDRIDVSGPWRIRVHGLVARPREIALDNLMAHVEPMGEILLECSGNSRGRHFGMLSAADWAGIPIAKVLGMIDVDRRATRMRISGFDDHSKTVRGSSKGASWIFSFEQLERYGAFLATHMNGERLPIDHGYPVRLLVPRWYGCTCAKWVDEIELVDDSAPATSQMREFSTRTQQEDRPKLARNFIDASMDQAALPVRVEKWRVAGTIRYRVVGIMWGGEKPTRDLAMRFNKDEDAVPVDHCPGQKSNLTWAMWRHEWRPASPGRYDITLHVTDPTIRTRRLDRRYYRRAVRVDKV